MGFDKLSPNELNRTVLRPDLLFFDPLFLFEPDNSGSQSGSALLSTGAGVVVAATDINGARLGRKHTPHDPPYPSGQAWSPA